MTRLTRTPTVNTDTFYRPLSVRISGVNVAYSSCGLYVKIKIKNNNNNLIATTTHKEKDVFLSFTKYV